MRLETPYEGRTDRTLSLFNVHNDQNGSANDPNANFVHCCKLNFVTLRCAPRWAPK